MATTQFTLLYESDLDLDSIIVYENGIPIPHDSVALADSFTIELTDPDLSAVFSIDYNILTRFESAALQLPTGYANFIWFTDYVKHSRLNFVPLSKPISIGIQFGFDYTATLAERSDLDITQARLVADDGITVRPVATGSWGFIDPLTVQINPAVFNANAVYTLSYNTHYINPIPYCTVLVELRQADTQNGLTSATYAPCDVNTKVPTKQWFQMRATISGIQDVDDIKLYSLLLKGLNTDYGSNNQPVNNNVKGVFTDDDFNAGTLTNLEVVAATPARFSYVKPGMPSRILSELMMIKGSVEPPPPDMFIYGTRNGSYPSGAVSDVDHNPLATYYDIAAQNSEWSSQGSPTLYDFGNSTWITFVGPGFDYAQQIKFVKKLDETGGSFPAELVMPAVVRPATDTITIGWVNGGAQSVNSVLSLATSGAETYMMANVAWEIHITLLGNVVKVYPYWMWWKPV